MKYLVFKETGVTFWWRSEIRKLGFQQVLRQFQNKLEDSPRSIDFCRMKMSQLSLPADMNSINVWTWILVFGNPGLQVELAKKFHSLNKT